MRIRALFAASVLLSVVACSKGDPKADPAKAATSAAAPTPPAPPPKPKKTAWTMNQVSDTAEQVRVRQIALVGDETRVTLRYESVKKVAEWIRLRAPGQPEAFRIVGPDGATMYELKRADGVKLEERKLVPAGEAVEINLYFPAIDPTWKSVRLQEGAVRPEAGTGWWLWESIPLDGA